MDLNLHGPHMPLRAIRVAAHMNVDDEATQYAPRVVALWT
jgi:hypothetical protein